MLFVALGIPQTQSGWLLPMKRPVDDEGMNWTVSPDYNIAGSDSDERKQGEGSMNGIYAVLETMIVQAKLLIEMHCRLKYPT